MGYVDHLKLIPSFSHFARRIEPHLQKDDKRQFSKEFNTFSFLKPAFIYMKTSFWGRSLHTNLCERGTEFAEALLDKLTMRLKC